MKILLILAVITLTSTLPSFGQIRDCEVASQCYAIAFNAVSLAKTLREQGQMVKWDEIEALEDAHYYFMGSVMRYCNYPDFSEHIEGYTERDFDRIIEGSRYRSFIEILSQYKSETQSCMDLSSR